MVRHDHSFSALIAQSTAIGSAEAICFPGTSERLTFADWAERAGALARGLIDLGVQPGDHVALLSENRTEWLITQMAVAAAGAVFTPLNTHYRRDDLIVALNQSGARAILTTEAFRSNPYLETLLGVREELGHLEHIITIGCTYQGLTSFADLLAQGRTSTAALPKPDPDAPGALLYTSGTTGTPKGALLTHRAMMMNAGGTALRLKITAGDRWTSIIPLFHCAGCIMNVLGGLQAGACYVGVPAFDPVLMFEVIEAERCTVLSGVPTSYLAMLDHPERCKFDLTSLRTGTCGGADCNPDMLERCASAFPIPQVCQVYGQTETSTLIAAPEADDPLRFSTTGPPLPGFDVRIIDPDTGGVLPPNRIGEIQARGSMIMLGYHNQPKATAEALIDGGWLRTGDLGLLNDTGHLVIAGGRLRDMIIRGGENIYPVEIENLLHEHPAVGSVAVFGLPDDYYGERVAAAIVALTAVTSDELTSFCRDRIARFKIPVNFFEAQAFPLTPSGKVRKTELRDQAVCGDLPILQAARS